MQIADIESGKNYRLRMERKDGVHQVPVTVTEIRRGEMVNYSSAAFGGLTGSCDPAWFAQNAHPI